MKKAKTFTKSEIGNFLKRFCAIRFSLTFCNGFLWASVISPCRGFEVPCVACYVISFMTPKVYESIFECHCSNFVKTLKKPLSIHWSHKYLIFMKYLTLLQLLIAISPFQQLLAYTPMTTSSSARNAVWLKSFLCILKWNVHLHQGLLPLSIKAINVFCQCSHLQEKQTRIPFHNVFKFPSDMTNTKC